MKIVVAIKQVPARDSQLRISPGGKWIEESDLLDGCNLVGEVQVEVVTRSIHTLTLGRLREWLNSGGSPKEVAMKSDLRERKSPPRAGSAPAMCGGIVRGFACHLGRGSGAGTREKMSVFACRFFAERLSSIA